MATKATVGIINSLLVSATGSGGGGAAGRADAALFSCFPAGKRKKLMSENIENMFKKDVGWRGES